MGGTFDPVHHGHLVAASEVLATHHLDEVLFVPTGQPWQKHDDPVTPAEHRYLMTVIATAANPRFTVSRVDIDRPGPTYTIDTLRDLRTQRGAEADLFFITGADALAEIFTWRDADELFDLARFVGCTRPGYEMDPQTLAAIRLAGRLEGMITDPVYEGKSMAGMIDLVTRGEIPRDSNVLYAHLGGQPALNAYAALFTS